jgi:hypothetical protein
MFSRTPESMLVPGRSQLLSYLWPCPERVSVVSPPRLLNYLICVEWRLQRLFARSKGLRCRLPKGCCQEQATSAFRGCPTMLAWTWKQLILGCKRTLCGASCRNCTWGTTGTRSTVDWRVQWSGSNPTSIDRLQHRSGCRSYWTGCLRYEWQAFAFYWKTETRNRWHCNNIYLGGSSEHVLVTTDPQAPGIKTLGQGTFFPRNADREIFNSNADIWAARFAAFASTKKAVT